MELEGYTEYLKYNYRDAAQELGKEAEPADILEYLLGEWKKLSPSEKQSYKQYRSPQRTHEEKSGRSPRRHYLETSGELEYGGMGAGDNGEEDEDDDEKFYKPDSPHNAWNTFLKETRREWLHTLPAETRPRDSDFVDWAAEKWNKMSKLEKERYMQMGKQMAAEHRRNPGPIRRKIGTKPQGGMGGDGNGGNRQVGDKTPAWRNFLLTKSREWNGPSAHRKLSQTEVVARANIVWRNMSPTEKAKYE
jgi:hypothetical protein